ncbi:poly(A) RNA polymerase GLD2-A-like [Asterias rubens]|uniref:poly(A) RNA polymerase GLD2-A-like n=1 Tax=Asterias rubens TaxID=7604 RepID=UPI0014559771|nr:poly(A) RNA polymerase GLD2-A-like [Asterias rubens]XP_033634007.1 poly(A) RNA polymerase GLD2-A-like [Asterias rubens]
MSRNSTPNSNFPRTHPLPSRVLPNYQRQLAPTPRQFYPYQTTPLQNGAALSELFLIDKGRRSITISGAGHGVMHQPQQAQPRTSPYPETHPKTPGAYDLLVKVLGGNDKSKIQTSTSATQSTTLSTSQSRVPATATSTTQSRDIPGGSVRLRIPQPQRRPVSADFHTDRRRVVLNRNYIEQPTGGNSKTRTPTHTYFEDQPTGKSVTPTPTHTYFDKNRSRSAPSTTSLSSGSSKDLTDTPKSSRDHSDSSGKSRKRSHDDDVVSSPKPDTSNPTGKVLDRLSQAVWQNCGNAKQSRQQLYTKENLRRSIETIIQEKFPGSMLFLVGSTLNGFATNHSDTDLCLMITMKEVNQKNHALYLLNILHNLLLKRCNLIRKAQVIRAKVPILKFSCSSAYSGLECDININNATGIRNTHLLQTYSKLDWRVTPLIILIKQWASAQGINDASQGTLSSYSLVLMVLNYLQVKCKPCVIPSLHKLYPDTFNSTSDVRFVYDVHPSNPLPSFITFKSKNTQTLWELLQGFFDYYVLEFNFHSTVVSVRHGTVYKLADAPYKTIDWINKFIYIEEPFDGNNTARAVFNDGKFCHIMQQFGKTQRKLKAARGDSCNPEALLDLRFEKSPRDEAPLKKKKR